MSLTVTFQYFDDRTIITFEPTGLNAAGLEGWTLRTILDGLPPLETRERLGSVGGGRIMGYPNDHVPLHLHWHKGGVEIKIDLDDTGALTVVKGKPKLGELKKIRKFVQENRKQLSRAYRNVLARRVT